MVLEFRSTERKAKRKGGRYEHSRRISGDFRFHHDEVREIYETEEEARSAEAMRAVLIHMIMTKL